MIVLVQYISESLLLAGSFVAGVTFWQVVRPKLSAYVPTEDDNLYLILSPQPDITASELARILMLLHGTDLSVPYAVPPKDYNKIASLFGDGFRHFKVSDHSAIFNSAK